MITPKKGLRVRLYSHLGTIQYRFSPASWEEDESNPVGFFLKWDGNDDELAFFDGEKIIEEMSEVR